MKKMNSSVGFDVCVGMFRLTEEIRQRWLNEEPLAKEFWGLLKKCDQAVTEMRSWDSCRHEADAVQLDIQKLINHQPWPDVIELVLSKYEYSQRMLNKTPVRKIAREVAERRRHNTSVSAPSPPAQSDGKEDV